MMEMGTEEKRWSLEPPENYAVEIDGVMWGIGTNPVFSVVPGAWNILVLSCNALDGLLPWTGDPQEFPLSVGALPAAVGTALQTHTDSRYTLGDLAATTTPLEFLSTVRGRTDLILPTVFGPVWWGLALIRATALQAFTDNVTHVDFKKNRHLH